MAYFRWILYLTTFMFADTLADICMNAVCEYEFIIRHSRSMTYMVKDPLYDSIAYKVDFMNGSFVIVGNELKTAANDKHVGMVVQNHDVVSLDGVSRNIIVINDKFPGPTIEVVENAEVAIRITNHLVNDAVTIHWHGMHQRGTPWMDGTAMVSQCAILPRQSFTYRFIASPAGTHWYHSHMENQKMDGISGLFIVHDSVPNLMYYPLLVSDWYSFEATEFHVLNPFGTKYRGTGELHVAVPLRAHTLDGVQTGAIQQDLYNIIVNGRGRPSLSNNLPLESFYVKAGESAKFHAVHTGTEYSFQISIDSHNITVDASDGFNIKQVDVTFVIINPGETIDLIVKADQPAGRYWMRVRTLGEGLGLSVTKTSKNIVKEGLAVVSYDTSDNTIDPSTSVHSCTQLTPCAVFNCPFAGYPATAYKQCINWDSVKSTKAHTELAEEFGLDDPTVTELFINVGFSFGSSINARKFVMPMLPLLGHDFSSGIAPCTNAACNKGCLCTNILELPYNATVQMIISNLMSPGEVYAHHPIHMHGHSFAVVKIGYPPYNTSTGLYVSPNPDVQCNSAFCTTPRWLNGTPPTGMNTLDPPIKDTIVIPARGYVVLRFKANNPGYWLVHCHAEQHILDGMMLIMSEGAAHIPQVPRNFPTCNHFDYSHQDLLRNFNGKQSNNITPTSVMPPSDVTTETNDSDDSVVLTRAQAIGAAVGFFATGFVLTLIAIGIGCALVKCRRVTYETGSVKTRQRAENTSSNYLSGCTNTNYEMNE